MGILDECKKASVSLSPRPKLEILRRAGAMPISSRRCGMITRREAERLCKSFLGDNSPPKLPDNFAFEVSRKVLPSRQSCQHSSIYCSVPSQSCQRSIVSRNCSRHDQSCQCLSYRFTTSARGVAAASSSPPATTPPAPSASSAATAGSSSPRTSSSFTRTAWEIRTSTCSRTQQTSTRGGGTPSCSGTHQR